MDTHEVAHTEHFTFINSDGVEIDGWVLYPGDFDPEKTYPAIFDVHGGPQSAYGEGFFHEMQYWAGLGYIVFFCNPRGSSGKGGGFADIYGDNYGVRDYNDLMEFTDEVLKRVSQIDVKRVAMTGGSYGGFMTNWIIGHTDRFACAASQRSISNWVLFPTPPTSATGLATTRWRPTPGTIRKKCGGIPPLNTPTR